MRLVVGFVLLYLVLLYEAIERSISKVVFGDERDIKDFRRRNYPGNSIRTWTFFERWTWVDPRLRTAKEVKHQTGSNEQVQMLTTN